MSGSTGERSFADIITLPGFDTGSFIANLHLPYLLDELRGWLFVSTGLASSSSYWTRLRAPLIDTNRSNKSFGLETP